MYNIYIIIYIYIYIYYQSNKRNSIYNTYINKNVYIYIRRNGKVVHANAIIYIIFIYIYIVETFQRNVYLQ